MDNIILVGGILATLSFALLGIFLYITHPRLGGIKNFKIKNILIPPALTTIDYLLKAIIFAPIFKLLTSPTTSFINVVLSIVFIIVFCGVFWFFTLLTQKINSNLKDN